MCYRRKTRIIYVRKKVGRKPGRRFKIRVVILSSVRSDVRV